MPAKSRSYVWVRRDLSNGDGAGGRPHPTYIWVFKLKRDALAIQTQSTLGPVECWEKSAIYHFYDRSRTSQWRGYYCVRRSKDWLD